MELPVTGDRLIRAPIVRTSREIWSVASVSLKDSCVNQPDRKGLFDRVPGAPSLIRTQLYQLCILARGRLDCAGYVRERAGRIRSQATQSALTAEVRPGDDVVVVGLGGVGVAALLGAVSYGAHRIFAVDPVEWNRDQALKFVAKHAYADIDNALMAITQIAPGRTARKMIVRRQSNGADLDKFTCPSRPRAEPAS